MVTRGNRVSETNLSGAAGGYYLQNQNGTWTVYDNDTDAVIRTNIPNKMDAILINDTYHDKKEAQAHYNKGFDAGYQRAREEFLQGIVPMEIDG